MGLLDEKDKLKRAIDDAEIRLKSIEANVEQLGKEIDVLSPRKNELEQNIEFHKKDDVIPIAQEYKKSKDELAKTKARLKLIVPDLAKSKQAAKDVLEIIEKFKKDYAKLSESNDNNVLRPNFGGKRG